MKRIVLLSSVLIVGLAMLTFTNCSEPKNEEVCEQEELCTAKLATACCDDAGCVYKYDGKEYPDTEAGLEQLYAEMGCTSGSRLADVEAEKEIFKMKLRALMARVRGQL